ncbi:MAG TPA: dolichyl-phosphate beta-glucosyltransferase [Dehalococcoidia bacterium]
MTPPLSVIIPAYNEAVTFAGGALDAVAAYLERRWPGAELVVVDDGSTDGTADRVEQARARHPCLRLVRRPHGGKAAAVRAGVEAAAGEVIAFTDADQSTPIETLEPALACIVAGADVVIGSREAPGSARIKEPVYRHLMGRAFNQVVRLLAVPGIRDTQCGFKVFRSEAARDLFPRLVVYGPAAEPVRGPWVTAFDVELLFLARRRGWRIAEVPVRWRHVPTGHVRPLRDAWRMLRDVLRIRWYALRGRYGPPRTRDGPLA